MLALLYLIAFARLACAEDIVKLASSGDLQSLESLWTASSASLDLNTRDPSTQQTPLMAATLMGHSEVVQWLLDIGADPSIPEKGGYTPMHGAAFQGRVAVAKVLVDHGIPIEDIHRDGYTPAFRATWGPSARHAETLKFLIEKGVDPNSRVQKTGKTLLMSALERGNLEALKVLLEMGADVNAQDKKGNTALHYLAQGVKKKEVASMVDVVLKYNPDFELPNQNGDLPWHLAQKNQNIGNVFESIPSLRDEL